MTSSAQPGPVSILGTNPPLVGPTPYVGGGAALVSEGNPDLAPSLFWGGIGVRDPRYLAHIGQGPLSAGGYANQDCGWYFAGPGIIAIDQVPSAIETNNIAAAQHMTNGTPLTLVSSSGAGITVLSAALTILPTGLVVPSGALAIDTSPAWQGGGSSGAFAFFNPANGIARAVSLTSTANLSTYSFTIKGYDIYGEPMTQTLAGPDANTVNTTKAFKFVISVTPNTTDGTNTVSVGTSDIYGLPLYSTDFAHAKIVWNETVITANTGFTAAVTTTPSATTGDVRGTYATQSSASDGTKKMTIYQALDFSVIGASYAAVLQALVGKTQF